MRSIIRRGEKAVSLEFVNVSNAHGQNGKERNSNGQEKNENKKRKRFLHLPFRRKKALVVADNRINSKLGVNILPVAVVEVDAAVQERQEPVEPVQAEPQPPHPEEPHPEMPPPDDPSREPQHQSAAPMNLDNDVKTACTLALLSLFPEICPDFLEKTSDRLLYDYEAIVSHLLDEIDAGKPYPQRPSLKRKRVSGVVGAVPDGGSGSSSNVASIKDTWSFGDSVDIIAALDNVDDDDGSDDDDDSEDNDSNNSNRRNNRRNEAATLRAIAAFSTDARAAAISNTEYTKQASILLRQAYLKVPQRYIVPFLQQHRNCLLLALLALDDTAASASANGADAPRPYKEKVRGTLVVRDYTLSELPQTIAREKAPVMKDILVEYEFALRLRARRRDARAAADGAVRDEAANYAQAERDGAVRECECCCADVPLNRMVHCDSAATTHFFCKDCARRMAESQIGLCKYELACMSMASCAAGFSRDQRRRFLSAKTARALERIEQDFVLRVAGLEGLARCPFCPFAAEYPPVEVNSEFVCQSPACAAVSCRRCSKETHIPQTCAEAEAARGDRPSARLLVEEAMSRALIRSCNRCATPFIKEHGCNKMTCTNAGCGNVQCYVCHASCDYAHFDDTTRGGKKGNCPLFESVAKRHDDEVQAAEAKARDELVRLHPGLDVSTLHFDLSASVLDDERKRRVDDQARVAGRIAGRVVGHVA